MPHPGRYRFPPCHRLPRGQPPRYGPVTIPRSQRHHLLPRQLLFRARCFGTMFAAIGRERVGFDDFRTNGLLLPASEEATIRTGMPLHRGPHHRYNEVVIARVGRIEESWSLAPQP